MNQNKLETISNLFEGKEIRSVWNSEREEYYFSVVDVIGALTDSDDPSHYWRTLKSRMIKEGNETVTNCDTFKLKARDGKMRSTNMLDTKGILRLIEIALKNGYDLKKYIYRDLTQYVFFDIM